MLSDRRFSQCPFRISGNEIVTWWPGELNLDLVLPMLEFCVDVVAHLPPAAQQTRAPLADLRWSVAQ